MRGVLKWEHPMVIGLFPTADAAGMCLSNLEEADFSPKDISVVMKTKEDVERLAKTSGAWNGISTDELAARLTRAGVAPTEVNAYRDSVLHGGVFVGIAAGDASQAAKEMLDDARAQDVRIVPEANGSSTSGNVLQRLWSAIRGSANRGQG